MKKKNNLKDFNIEKKYSKKYFLAFLKTHENKIYYKNETSKNYLDIYDENSKQYEKLSLKYNRLGNTNKQLNIWYTSIIVTEESNTITNHDLSKIIVHTKNLIIAKYNTKYNISVAMLLD